MKHQRLIAAAYEKGVDEEYNRLTESVLREYEFRLVTQSVLSRVAPKAAILDIGCGPGRYAEFFLKNGFQVGLVDISANSLEAFSKRTRNRYLPQILFSQISCATDLDWIASQSVDAVVLLGPMYHIVNDDERRSTLKHCHRILKLSGHLFVIFMSPYPKLNPTLEGNPDELVSPDYIENLQTDGITFARYCGLTVPQYRCWPSKAVDLIKETGFYDIEVKNVEGVASHFSDTQLSAYDDLEEKQLFFDMLDSTGSEKHLEGITHQFLVVARKCSIETSPS